MTVVFQHNVYVSVLETAGENPLLDSRFPDISGKGRGYQLQACNDGVPDWPQLRKVSIWQTVGALEQVKASLSVKPSFSMTPFWFVSALSGV